MPAEGFTKHDNSQKAGQSAPIKKVTMFAPNDVTDSMPPKPATFHKQPPAPPPKPFNRLPNHMTGEPASRSSLS